MGNTYLVSGQATTAEHWLAFPFPWNVVPPRHSDLMPGDVMKITASALPKFGGQPGDYIPWRSAFLPCVHVTPLDLSLKVMLLMGLLCGQRNGISKRYHAPQEHVLRRAQSPGGTAAGPPGSTSSSGGEL